MNVAAVGFTINHEQLRNNPFTMGAKPVNVAAADAAANGAATPAASE